MNECDVDIAYALGFGGMTYLNNLFKRITVTKPISSRLAEVQITTIKCSDFNTVLTQE